MTDNSATATYRGTGLTTSGWRGRGAATEADVDGSHADLTNDQDPDAIQLEGSLGEAYGAEHNGTKVPNANITHVHRPAAIRGLPADHRTNQNPLSAAKP